jgi:hypothetical protein
MPEPRGPVRGRRKFLYMQKNDLNWFVDTKKLLKYCERFGSLVDAYYYVGKDSPPEAGQQAFLSALTYMATRW